MNSASQLFCFHLNAQKLKPCPCVSPREIDFVKREEELKKSLDEKEKWYVEQLDSLQDRVRKQLQETPLALHKGLNGVNDGGHAVLSIDSCAGVQRAVK